jgi:hypothetical protein
MRARNAIILTCAALMIQVTAWSADLRIDFRQMGFDNTALRLVGQDAEQLVRPTEGGLLIRIPPKEGIVGPVGLAPRAMIRGDFAIVAEFELLRCDRPREGRGVGIGLEVDFPSTAMGPITIGRFAIPAEGDRFTWAAPSSAVGSAGHGPTRVPAGARTGKLRLVRTASLVRADYADGGGPFKLLREQEVGGADARIAWFGVETGTNSGRIEALLKSLTIGAGEWVETAETRAVAASGMDPMFLSITALIVVLLGLLTWKLWPARSGNPLKERVS